MNVVIKYVFKITFVPIRPKESLVYIVEAFSYEDACKKIAEVYRSAKAIEFVGELSGTIPLKG